MIKFNFKVRICATRQKWFPNISSSFSHAYYHNSKLSHLPIFLSLLHALTYSFQGQQYILQKQQSFLVYVQFSSTLFKKYELSYTYILISIPKVCNVGSQLYVYTNVKEQWDDLIRIKILKKYWWGHFINSC